MDLRTSIYRYCNYQERCHQEVRNKLYELGGTTPEVENLMAELIEVDLLNEERYAISFARGRFRIKNWGRLKIINELKQRRISDYIIKKAVGKVDPEEYYQTLMRLCSRKADELKHIRPEGLRKNKVFRFLMQKGYESGLITEAYSEAEAKKSA